MTNYEIIIAISSIITTIAFLIALIYASRQLRQIKKIHSDNHKWNRRLAAQEAIRSGAELGGIVEKLDQKFKFITSPDPISHKIVNEKFDQDPDLRVACHRMLNFYEMLARGIKQGIYDHEIIKDARRQVMIMIFSTFSLYIKDRRKINNEAWTQFESIVNKWKAEETQTPYKEPIGGNA